MIKSTLKKVTFEKQTFKNVFKIKLKRSLRSTKIHEIFLNFHFLKRTYPDRFFLNYFLPFIVTAPHNGLSDC
jgi:hypothetical protein